MVLEWEDWTVIGIYFIVVLGTGLGISIFGRKTGNAADFLLAGRTMGFLPVIFLWFIFFSAYFFGLFRSLFRYFLQILEVSVSLG